MSGFNELPHDICRAIISSLDALYSEDYALRDQIFRLSQYSTISRHWQDVAESVIWRHIRILHDEVGVVSRFICPHRRSLIEQIEFTTCWPMPKRQEKNAEPEDAQSTSWMGDFPNMLQTWEVESSYLARPLKDLSLVILAFPYEDNQYDDPDSPREPIPRHFTDDYSPTCGCSSRDVQNLEVISSQRRTDTAKGSFSMLTQVKCIIRSSQPLNHQFNATRDILSELLKPWPPNLAGLKVDFSNEWAPNPLGGHNSHIDLCCELHDYSQNLTSLTLTGQFLAMPDLFWPAHNKRLPDYELPQWPQITRLVIYACLSQDEKQYWYIPEIQRLPDEANSVGPMSSDSMEEHLEVERLTSANHEHAKIDIQKLYLSLALSLPRMPKLALLAILNSPGVGLTWQSAESLIACPLVEETGQYVPRLDFWGKYTYPDNYVVQALKDATTTTSDKDSLVVGFHDDPLDIDEISWLTELPGKDACVIL